MWTKAWGTQVVNKPPPKNIYICPKCLEDTGAESAMHLFADGAWYCPRSGHRSPGIKYELCEHGSVFRTIVT